MKVRQAGQNAPADIAARDFRRELEEREAKLSKEGELLKSQISVSFSKVSDADVASALPAIEVSWDDVPADGRDKDDAKLGKLASECAPNWDRSDSEDEKEGSDDSSSEEDEDSEDEDAALMRELELIKRERAAEAAEKVFFVLVLVPTPSMHLITKKCELQTAILRAFLCFDCFFWVYIVFRAI